MRLTLRNLLAYLHGALSPENHAAMEALVQATPRIQTLIERCRALTSRPIAAPAVDQAAAMHQAETVAKYLDFTLPDDQVAVFEKAVLASDELLAEVVNAHRVLADVVANRTNVTAQIDRQRLLNLASSNGAAHAAQQPAMAAATAEVAATAHSTEFVTSPALHQESLHDSGDLSEYLGDADDDEELSVDAAEQRAREAEKRAAVAAATSYTSGSATATRVTTYGVRDPFKQQEKVPDALLEKPEPSKMPLIAGAVGGGVIAVGVLVWLVGSMFSGPTDARPTGPHVYGVQPSDGAMCELRGTIQYQPSGASPSPDAGALIVVWPVNPQRDGTVQSTTAIMERLQEKQQSPYNLNLVVAKADDNGNFHMRMLDNTEFYIMVLSQRSTTNNPKTWGDAVETIKSQVEDPANLIGQSNYHFGQLTMPGEKATTFDHTFTE